MIEHMSRGPRLHALRRLLEYAVAESEELGLADLGSLLGAAALAIGEELNVKAGRSQQAWKLEVLEKCR
jgi:hypothetical protein